MDNQQAKISEVAKRRIETDSYLGEVFNKYIKADGETSAKVLGWLEEAKACALSVANLFLAARNPESGRSLGAISDLAFVLHGNNFWNTHSAFLMPLVIAGINAQRDYGVMKAEQMLSQDNKTFDILLSGCKVSHLEVFPLIVYLALGPEAMVKSSVAFKQDLAPYFME